MPKKKSSRSISRPAGIGVTHVTNEFCSLPNKYSQFLNGHVLFLFFTTCNRVRAQTTRELFSRIPSSSTSTEWNSDVFLKHFKTKVKIVLDSYYRFHQLTDHVQFERFKLFCSERFPMIPVQVVEELPTCMSGLETAPSLSVDHYLSPHEASQKKTRLIMASPVPEEINFSKEEENICAYWHKIDAFKTSLKHSKGKKRYSFYDGPPFATGLPHYGHILAGTIKDTVTRWAHQNGYHVERRFGWDCHGLPVEYEIDKTLNIKGPADVEKIGIDGYNSECRKIVMRYASEWETIVTRLGRWIDFRNDYKTMYPSFMESVWWTFKQLYDSGLVYRGCKVMPFSTACSTPLSNFESGQNYKEVTDPAVIVSFPLNEDPSVSLIAWTTTPWTLPSNLALCVNADLAYVKIKDLNARSVYIMMEARLETLFKSDNDYEVLERFNGAALKDKSYEPLFPYFIEMKQRGAFRVLTDSYVSAESGTGVVHQAPYHGEDDYRICLANGIITRDMPMVCPVDACGKFTSEVTDFSDIYVKEADKLIVKHLKQNGRLIHQGTTKHSYPFCWRSETPLIYKAVPSWFIRVECAVEKLLANNQKTYWVPDFVKQKRFANWLSDAHDWAVSRNRYWGTPIPLWMSEDGEEVVCVGSVKELCRLTGQQNITDLHREFVDQLTIPSSTGRGVLRRVPEVFDCWYESGCMPYASIHYPFENKDEFSSIFPADFIAEGLDQTRGWFYTLLVLSTLLFDKPPFKNLIVNGLVLAADGFKMSKRKKNYPDPMTIVDKFGADALRLYLINSPVVRADSLRFTEDGVRDVVKDVFLPWYNAYRFFIQNVITVKTLSGLELQVNDSDEIVSSNVMDRWILSSIQSLIKFVHHEMNAYRLYTVTPQLVKFVGQLTNWYVRMNRRRLKGEGGKEDCLEALHTLFSVLFDMVRLMAPFLPFLTEHMYLNLKNLLSEQLNHGESVHFLMVPHEKSSLIDVNIERAVGHMQSVIELARVIRDRKTLPVKYPLKEVIAIHPDQRVVDDILSLSSYIQEELNVKAVEASTERERYGLRLRAEPNHKILGQRLKGEYKTVNNLIKNLDNDTLLAFQRDGKMTVGGYELVEGEVTLLYQFEGGSQSCNYEAHSDGQITVLLDVTPDQYMMDEGIAREVINRCQKLRKQAHLVPTDEIIIYYRASQGLSDIISRFNDYITLGLKRNFLPCPADAGLPPVIIKESNMKVKDHTLDLVITKDMDGHKSSIDSIPEFDRPYVNIVLVGCCPGEMVRGDRGVVLLCPPLAQGSVVSSNDLLHLAKSLFGVRNRAMQLYLNHSTRLSGSHDVSSLIGQLLQLCPANNTATMSPLANIGPVCRYVCTKLSNSDKKTCVLLENPVGNILTYYELLTQVRLLFQIPEREVKLKLDKEDISAVGTVDLHTRTLVVV